MVGLVGTREAQGILRLRIGGLLVELELDIAVFELTIVDTVVVGAGCGAECGARDDEGE